MYYVRQLHETDCGFASLKMLLANVFKDKRFLYLKQDLLKERYSYYELINIAKKYNLFLSGLKFNNPNELKKYPNKIFLATIKINSLNHLVMVKKCRRGLKIYDPLMGRYHISYKKFFKIWDKTILSIYHHKENNLKDDDLLAYKTNNKASLVVNIIIRSLTIINSVLGLYFISYDNYLYVGLGLLLGAVVCEVLYRLINIYILKNMDNHLSDNFMIKDGYHKKFFIDFNAYKKDGLTLYPNLFFNVLMCGVIIFIFVLNDISNLYGLMFAIIVGFINYGLIRPLYIKKENNILIKEKHLLDKPYELDNLKVLSNHSYKVASSYILIQTLFSILIISLVVVMSYLNSNLDISYIIFYSFGIIFFKNQFENVLNFYRLRQNIIKIRMRLLNMLVLK